MKKWLANLLARWARRIYPESEEVKAFYADRMMDMLITGNSFVKVSVIDPKDVIIHSQLVSPGDGGLK